MRFALVLSLLLAILAVIFASYNPGQMEVVIPFTGSQVVSQKPLVIIGTLLIGVVIGLLASVPGRIGATLRARRAEKELLTLRGGTPSPSANIAATDASIAAAQAQNAAARAEAAEDAAETQRLADEVARRTSSIQGDDRRPL